MSAARDTAPLPEGVMAGDVLGVNRNPAPPSAAPATAPYGGGRAGDDAVSCAASTGSAHGYLPGLDSTGGGSPGRKGMRHAARLSWCG